MSRGTNFTDTTKKLSEARQNLLSVTEAYEKAVLIEKIAKRIPPELRTAEQKEKVARASRWADTVGKMKETAELRVKTLETELKFISKRAKNCTSPNGKSIRV